MILLLSIFFISILLYGTFRILFGIVGIYSILVLLFVLSQILCFFFFFPLFGIHWLILDLLAIALIVDIVRRTSEGESDER